MKHAALTFVVFLLGLFINTETPNAQAPTPLRVGACIVLELRSSPRPRTETPFDRSCRTYIQMTDQEFSQFSQRYQYFFEFLSAAYTVSELAHCGYSGCVGNNRSVRIYLVQDWEVGAGISQSNDEVTIYITAAILDFINGISSYLAFDLVQSDITFAMTNRYWDSLVRAGGIICNQGAISTPLSGQDTIRLRETNQEFRNTQVAFTQSILFFVFSHELSHVVTGGRCRSSLNDPLSTEAACDEIAFDVLRQFRRGGGLSPIGTIAFLLSMGNFEQLFMDQLNRMNRPSWSTLSLHQLQPARDWQSRARLLLNHWEASCRREDSAGSEPGQPSVCGNANIDARQIVSRWITRQLPLQCIPNNSR